MLAPLSVLFPYTPRFQCQINAAGDGLPGMWGSIRCKFSRAWWTWPPGGRSKQADTPMKDAVHPLLLQPSTQRVSFLASFMSSFSFCFAKSILDAMRLLQHQ
ncbi:hypothetical protein XENOCAPTIV_023776, partial [Xenoophorus captivus]